MTKEIITALAVGVIVGNGKPKKCYFCGVVIEEPEYAYQNLPVCNSCYRKHKEKLEVVEYDPKMYD